MIKIESLVQKEAKNLALIQKESRVFKQSATLQAEENSEARF